MGDSSHYQFPVALNWDQGPETLKRLRNKLQLYFGSKSKSDGGECEIRDSDCSQGYILIYYKEEAVRDRVLQKKTHELILPGGKTLQLIVRLLDKGNTKSSPPSKDAKTSPPLQETPADCKDHQSPGEHEKPTKEDDEVTQSPLSSLILIENLKDSCTDEILNLLVENISEKNEGTDFSMERIPEIQSAVVTFNSENDVTEFIGRFSGSPRVKQQNLRYKCLEKTKSIRVEGLPANTSGEFLELYFESKKHGGGPIEEKEILLEEGAAIITFASAEVVKTVLTNQHRFENSTLFVYPYYKSIGHWLFGEKGTHVTTPEPVECPISVLILEFISKRPEIKLNIEKHMNDHYCDVKWPDPGYPKPFITLSFPEDRFTHLRTMTKIAPTWSSKVQNEFSLLMSKYQVIEFDLKPPVWEATREKVSSSSSDGILIKPDLAAGKAFVVGIVEDVTKIEPIFRKLFEETTRQLNRVEDDMPLEPTAYKLLFAYGLEKSIRDQCPHVNISYDGITRRINLCGPRDDVLKAKSDILNITQDLKSKSIHFDSFIIQFLMAADNEEMSCSLLMTNNIKAIFQVEDNAVTLIGYSDKDLKNAEETLKKELVCKRISVEDKTVPQSMEWASLKMYLNQMFNTGGIKVSIQEFPVNDGNEVVITGQSSFVEDTYQQIHDFVQKNTSVQKEIKLKSTAAWQFLEEEKKKKPEWARVLNNVTIVPKQNFISMSGLKTYVEDAETLITRIQSSFHSDTLYIDKPGAKKFCFDNEDMYINTVRNKFHCIIYFQKDEDGRIAGHQSNQGEPLCEIDFQNEVTMTVYKGDLCQHSADVIIIASNKDLKPTGGPALALLKAAGPKVQKECEHIVQKEGSLDSGEFATTDGGHLPCKKVIHAIAPKSGEKEKSKCERLLRKVIIRSLEEAEASGLNSVAISMASFVYFGIPVEMCAEMIPKSIKIYTEDRKESKGIKNIHLVDDDDHTLKTLTKSLKEEYGEENVQITSQKVKKKYKYKKSQKKGDSMRKSDLSMVTTKEGVRVNVIQGNIEDATTNVVVNSVGKKLNLCSGAVAKALSKKAGSNLQDLLNKERHGKQVDDGSIFVTDGCNLSCDNVIHVVVPEWDNGKGSSEKILRNIVNKSLSKTEKRKKVSITFPAIGTGALLFPRDFVAALMFDEIINFSSKNKPHHVKEVNIMLHPKDSETIKAFAAELEKKIGSPKDAEKSSIKSLGQGVHEMKIGSVTFQAKRGDVTMEQADVTVSLSNSASETNQQDFKGASSKGIFISDTSKPDELKQRVITVLQDCETQRNTTIAITVAKSGLGMMSTMMAEAVLDAVAEFESLNSPKSVVMVKLMTPLQQILNDFHAAMKMKEASAATKQSSWMSGFVKKTKSLLTYFSPGSYKEEEGEEEDSNFFELRENIEPAIIQLCAESQVSVNKAKTWLRELIEKEQSENTMTDDWIQDFDDKDHEAIAQLQKKYQVTISFDMTSFTVKVLGLSKDVLKVSNKLQDMIKIVREKKTREREADLCSTLVEWGYLKGDNFIPFDKITNMELEKAKNEDIQSISMDINGVKYTVIVELESARDSQGNPIKLQRNSKHAQSTPSHWGKMEKDTIILSPGSEDYNKVQIEFEKSCQMKIIEIKRIQNKHLWLNYQIRKNFIDDKNGSKDNERLLFHGTESKAIENVNKNGFNRSFAGKNAAKAGKGTYFAVEAIYSSCDEYSVPDQNTQHKHMYLARVLTGVFCKGEEDMIVPPCKDNANPTDLYDSVTDDVKNPKVFAIFNDIQAYPEYLITFTK